MPNSKTVPEGVMRSLLSLCARDFIEYQVELGRMVETKHTHGGDLVTLFYTLHREFKHTAVADIPDAPHYEPMRLFVDWLLMYGYVSPRSPTGNSCMSRIRPLALSCVTSYKRYNNRGEKRWER
jgi:hypothetical protein